ncbi:hypothetical protein [Jiangella rhizosphaerae]|uniref:Uncharacterized protein n=1 Tax=Jiangella rhizosphaerae TaxID=2293569 RepID=A0A418KUY0_9ACTN|nr:hypothetical protein [Jiangella rhizosphaerae]RIQ31214.1 hypothetical protein DY240_06565 [Jiangella rhizosphaerae]
MASADDRRLGAVLVAVHALPAAVVVLLASFAIGWLAGAPLTIHRGRRGRRRRSAGLLSAG